MSKLFLLPYAPQKESIDRYCFNECGEIIINQIITFEGVACSVCRKDDCPYEEKRLEIGECELDDGRREFVVLRKLGRVDEL